MGSTMDLNFDPSMLNELDFDLFDTLTPEIDPLKLLLSYPKCGA